MSKRAIIYCRISSNDSEKDSLSRQESACLEYAAKEGYDVIDILKESDKGQSGADRHAPMMQEAIRLAERKTYDTLIVRDFTRFAREKYLGITNIGLLSQHNVVVQFVWNPIEGGEDSRFWQLVANFFGSDKERENVVRRLKEGKKDALKNGSVMFLGTPPFGYDNTRERVGNRMVYVPFIVEDEAEIVRLIFSLYTGPDRPSIREVCNTLNERGIPCPKMKRGKALAEWKPSTVGRILRNTSYIGEYRYGKTKLLSIRNVLTDELDENGNRTIKQTRDIAKRDEDKHIILNVPAIIDIKTWQIAQNRLARNKSPNKRTKFDFLLSHRIRCACGRSGLCKGKKSRGKRYMYYYCSAYHEGSYNADKCFMKISQSELDDLVWNRTEEILTKEGLLESKIKSLAEQEKEKLQPLESRLSYVCTMLDDAKASHDKLLNLILKSDASELLESKRLELEQEVKAHKKERDSLQAEIAEIENDFWLADLEERYEKEQEDFYGIAEIIRQDFADNPPLTFADKLAYIERYNVQTMLIKRENGLFVAISSDFGEVLAQLSHTYLSIGQLTLKEELPLMAA